LVKALTKQYRIKNKKSSPYHPQANGQVESTNKVIEAILTKTVQLHPKDWADSFPEALWAYYRIVYIYGNKSEDKGMN
jgi:transposase InsO family protein